MFDLMWGMASMRKRACEHVEMTGRVEVLVQEGQA